MLPLDRETQQLIHRYLLIRPTRAEDWLYLSSHHTQSNHRDVNRAWTEAFLPEFGETKTHRAISSHFGRHWFTTYWKKQQALPTEHVQYLRGNRVSATPDSLDSSSIDAYLHAYYEDIEQTFRTTSPQVLT